MNAVGDGTDYAISAEDAGELLGAVLLPADIRREVLRRYCRARGRAALTNLFAEFIGLANSVIANNREMVETVLTTEADWHPHTSEKVNLPTLFGALQGICLATSVDPADLCGGCAFRLGTPANQSPSTTSDADWCSHPGETNFMCHEDLDDRGEPTRGCRGFAQTRAARKQ